MYNLEKILIQKARKLEFEYVLATVHPDNIPSIKTIEKAELKLEKESVFFGKYIRNIYIMKSF